MDDDFSQYKVSQPAKDDFSQYKVTSDSQKKSPDQTTITPSQQSQNSGTNSNGAASPSTGNGYEWNNSNQQTTNLATGTEGNSPKSIFTPETDAKLGDKKPTVYVGEKAHELAVSQGDIEQHKTNLQNFQFSDNFDEYTKLNTQLQNTKPDDPAYAGLKKQVEDLRSKPFDVRPASWDEASESQDELRKKRLPPDMQNIKTVGEAADFHEQTIAKATDLSNKIQGTLKDIQDVVNPLQAQAGIKLNKDGYHELGLYGSFMSGLMGNIDNMAKAASLIGASPEQKQAIYKEALGQEVIDPAKPKNDAYVGVQTAGGLLPYFLPGLGLEAAGMKGLTATVGNAFINSAMMGLSGGYENGLAAYKATLAQSNDENAALESANKAFVTGGITGAAVGGVGLPLAGKLGEHVALGALSKEAVESAMTDGGLKLSNLSAGEYAAYALPKQAIQALPFPIAKVIDNKFAQARGENVGTMDNVGSSYFGALLIGHAIDGLMYGGPKLTDAVKNGYQDLIARYGNDGLQTQLIQQVTDGKLTQEQADAIGKPIQAKADAHAVMPENLTLEQQKQAEPIIQKIQANNATIGTKAALDVDKETAVADNERLTRQLHEIYGTPLSFDEHQTLGELHARMKEKDEEGKLKNPLSPPEKDLMEHLENRQNFKPNDTGLNKVDNGAPDGTKVSQEKTGQGAGDNKGTDDVNKTTPTKVGNISIGGHGEDEHTAQGLENGTEKTDKLTDTGKQEAVKQGEDVAKDNPDVKTVWHSTVGRTKETAKIVAKKASEVTGHEVKTAEQPLLDTWDIGKAEGTTPEGTFPEKEWAEKDNGNAKPDGGESWNNFADRNFEGWKWAKEHPDNDHAIASSKVERLFSATNDAEKELGKDATPEQLKARAKEIYFEKLKTEQDAVRKSSTESVDVRKSSENGNEVGKTHAKGESVTQTQAKEQIKKDRQELLAKEPDSLREAIMQFFVGGGKVNTADIRRYLGTKAKGDWQDLIGVHKNGGNSNSADMIANHMFGNWMDRGHDEQDIVNEIFNVLQEFGGKRSRMEEELRGMKDDSDFMKEYGISKKEYERLSEQQHTEEDNEPEPTPDDLRKFHQQQLSESQNRLADAKSEYDAAKNALDSDLKSKQGGLFEGKQQKLIDDTVEMQKRVDNAKKELTAAQAAVDKYADLVDENLPGQMETSPFGDIYQNSMIGAVPYSKEFFEHDVKPALEKIGNTIKGAYDLIKSALSPATGVSQRALDLIGKALGNRNLAAAQLDAAVAQVQKAFDKMPDSERIAFIDRMKRGESQPDKELQGFSDLIKGLDKQLYDEIAKYKPDLPWKENHFRVLWETIPGQNKSQFGILSRRPFQGTKGFMQKATLADMSEGIAMGGKPFSTNPITMFKRAYADGMKFVTAQKMWQAMKDDGFAKFVGSGKDAPQGFVKLDDNIARVYFPTDKGMVKAGEWYVDEGAGRILNNHLGTDYLRQRGTALGAVGTGLMELKNLYTQVELGLSAFHAVAEGLEASSSQLGLGLRRIVNLGEFKEGARDILKTLTAPVTTATEGRNAIRLISEKDFENSAAGKKYLSELPDAKQYIGDFFDGGGATKQSEDYRIKSVDALKEQAGKDNYIGAALRAMPAINETLLNPLFNHYIPMLKVGTFMKEFPIALRENQSRIEQGQISRQAIARQVVNFIDDRFGEMNFDNLYWDRTFKTSMQLLFRSITWKLGNVRALGGAIPEQAMEFMNAYKEDRRPNLSPKLAWSMSLAAVTAGLGSAIMYASTGKKPEELKDYIAPQIDKDDSNQRIVVPTYMKDVLHFGHSPLNYLGTSTAGDISKLLDIWANKDFYGYEIYDKNANVDEKAKQIASYYVPKPFSITSAMQQAKEGQSPARAAMSFLGLQKAPGYLTHTPMENKIFDLYNLRNAGNKPYAQKAADDAKKEISGLYRTGNVQEAQKELDRAIKTGLLRPTQARMLIRNAESKDKGSATDYFFKKLPIEDKLSLFKDMSEDEKKRFDPHGVLKKQEDLRQKPQ